MSATVVYSRQRAITLNDVASGVPLRPHAYERAGNCRYVESQNRLAGPRIYCYARLHVFGATMVRSIIYQHPVPSECISQLTAQMIMLIKKFQTYAA